LGHLASQCPERKKKKKEQEGPDTIATTTMEDFSSKFDKEFSLVTLVSSVGSGGFGGDNRWIVDRWSLLSHDGNLVSIPYYHRDRS
jgi:hypothetical protein